MRTLTLDKTYRPIGVISWKRAVALCWLDKADILEEYKDTIRSVSFEMHLPAVIRLKTYIMRRVPRIKFSKRNVYLRDKGRCQYCMNKTDYSVSTLDHVIPRARGGITKWSNIVIACNDCNSKKGDLLPQEANLRDVKPTTPSYSLILRSLIEIMEEIPSQWDIYLPKG